MLKSKRILLIISGGIAAYKCLDLIRLLRAQGAAVRCVLTKSATEFVTPLSVSALSGDKVYGDLFSLTDEHDMGHIQLSRDADLLAVVPATANILARMAQGIADDLATTALLATDKPVMVAPSMNVRMWEHEATRANMAILRARGVTVLGPDSGDMACGEYGEGRMVEPVSIVDSIAAYFRDAGRLAGQRALVTSGPTHEPVDPVRYIANRSSGKQGHAIAASLARAGAETILVTGPTQENDPPGVAVIHVETAQQMLDACQKALPADVAVCAAAVSDWRPAKAPKQKIKKNGAPPELTLAENPDILKTLSGAGNERPRLVIGFAAETGDVIKKATPKLAAKGCDWIVANDVAPGTGTFGGTENTVHLITANAVDSWPRMSKQAVADQLVSRIADALANPQQ
ncbi:MAG: bifunctional phosphopantothenoylcysteine decarboxylase/phosphopantothenate--cysteine ligase CoaBC [Rhodospirillaceae bacterium]|mgnify:CR=1 FL=1|nr:bifunctional phosphopantothenoylcysteine decarboxylase/phosphopantothenate--cysteine ligase CoaBC [Rhodospirillaceae bacterium]MBT5456248.1 bifunctional phosphopantothenoylcysteine decarboxylase/phosphopantothenate--cysteine ligase CoaBC [Rhodospirillaceae bacterium]